MSVADVISGAAPWHVECGDCRDVLGALPDGCVQCVCTSPPYFALRDYGTATWEGGDAACDHKQSNARPDHSNGVMLGTRGGRESSAAKATPFRGTCGKCGARRVDAQMGLEATPEAYVAAMVGVFREVRRVLRDDGVLWLNIGDSYNAYNGGAGPASGIDSPTGARTTQRPKLPSGHGLQVKALKPKDLLGVPWQLAFALRDDGWYLRSECVWAKSSPMPESVRDRPTRAHESVFLLTKSARYCYDQEAGRVEQTSRPHAGGNRTKGQPPGLERGGNGWLDPSVS